MAGEVLQLSCFFGYKYEHAFDKEKVSDFALDFKKHIFLFKKSYILGLQNGDKKVIIS